MAVVAAYLVLLLGLSGLTQWQGHQRLKSETLLRAKLAARSLLQESPEILEAALRDWQTGAAPRRPTVPRDLGRLYGIASTELLSPSGWSIDSEAGSLASHRLDASGQRRLESGETLVDASMLGSDPAYAIVTALQPILGDDGRLLGVLRVEVNAEPLALSHRQLRTSLMIQGGSTLAFAALLFFFLRWALRPLALLQQASTSTEAPDDELARADDTGFVIATYRRMIEQLRDKEAELRRLREVERNRADELQELNASIVDSMLSGAVVLDMSGAVRTMNAAAKDILRIAPDERITGRPHSEVLRATPELETRLGACLASGAAIVRDEVRLNLPGLGRRDLGVSVAPLRGGDGQQRGALAILVDLTEVKRLQEEVRLKESMAELGELSAGVAHEFRNSLAAILGFAQLIERRGEHETKESAKAISKECSELRRVVDDFLRFANPTRLMIEQVDLARLFAELESDVSQRAAGKGVSYTVECSLPVVSGDETLLRRMFTNLVRNACDACPEGGRIRVLAETRERELLVHVDDDGPGIPREDRQRIFVPFFSRKGQGTGLGLALARKVVIHHGGRLVADDSPLGGARLTVSLPLRPGPTSP